VNGILRAVMNEAVVILEEMQREEIEPAARMPEMNLPSVPSPQGKQPLARSRGLLERKRNRNNYESYLA